MAPRFSRPRLITADDKYYRAFVAQIMLSKGNQRPTRPPAARDLFGTEAEAALRSWLGQAFTLSDRRIVGYLEHQGRNVIQKYRELDAVVIDSPKAIQVFEIKASRSATSLRRAARQLRETRSILTLLYARVSITVLLVDTGIPTADDVAALLAGPEPPPVPPATLDAVLGRLPDMQPVQQLDERPEDPAIISLLRFSVEDIVALAGADQLHLDWEEDPEVAPPDEAENTLEEAQYAYTTDDPPEDSSDDDPDGSALAAALRQALAAREQQRGRP